MRNTILLFLLVLTTYSSGWAQNGYTSDNNSTGIWTDNGIWTRSQGWMQPSPGINVGGATSYIDLYGYVTRNGHLTLGGGSAVTVYDTLWIMGNINVTQGSSISVESGGVLIIDGNFVANGGTVSSNSGNVIVKGDLTLSGGANVNNNASGSDGFYVYGTASGSGGAQFNGGSNPSGGNFGDASDLGTDNNTLDSFVNATLPVDLVSFSASFVSTEVNVKWVTASELNNDKFEIYRSVDGIDFKYLGKVKGHGTSNALHEYTFVDPSPKNGTNYYRIKQIDFDGAYEFSPVSSAYVELSTSPSIKVIPTVVKEGNVKVKLSNIVAYNTRIVLSNLKGSLEHEQTIYPTKGISQDVVLTNTDQLKGGIYILTVYAAGNKYRKKVIIDR